MTSPPRAASDHAIVFDNVSVHYRTQKEPSVGGISFTVGWGEKVAIVGASGSGKSTLVHAMNGLIPHRHAADVSGTISVGGVDPRTAPLVETSAVAGTVLQDSDAQFVALTVAEDIAFSLENQEIPHDQMPERVHGVARRVGLEHLLALSPHDLSGGQKQRVAVAGVLVDQVPILLFDEPLANLDPSTGRAMIELADDLNKDHGTTVVIVEHRLEEVLHRSVDRILLMADGRLVADAPPDELVASGLLSEHGIRRPLHLTALNYAGVEPSASAAPARLETLTLTEAETARVRAWARAAATRVAKESVETHREFSRAHRADGETANVGPADPRAIRIRDLHVTYGHGDTAVHALNGVDLDVKRGDMISILGNNGAGKSTLARTIAGFDRPARGTIELNGEATDHLSIAEIGTRVGFVLQDPGHMLSHPLINDELALGPRAHGFPEDEVRERVAEALNVCGLTPYRTWPASALSHGQKKRVSIAAVLTLRPSILILDEPTAGQDLRHYTEFMEFIRELNQAGTTVILITHDMHLALEYTPRVVVMSGGRVIADDYPEHVLVNSDITARANLVRTSLYDLAEQLNLPRNQFVDTVIAVDRAKREAGHGR